MFQKCDEDRQKRGRVYDMQITGIAERGGEFQKSDGSAWPQQGANLRHLDREMKGRGLKKCDRPGSPHEETCLRHVLKRARQS